METEKLAQNNIKVQLSLLDDIKSNYSSVLYDINLRACEMKATMSKSKHNEDGTVLFSKEDYNKLYDFIIILHERDRFSNLGNLSKTAYPEIKQKLELLSQLRS